MEITVASKHHVTWGSTHWKLVQPLHTYNTRGVNFWPGNQPPGCMLSSISPVCEWNWSSPSQSVKGWMYSPKKLWSFDLYFCISLHKKINGSNYAPNGWKWRQGNQIKFLLTHCRLRGWPTFQLYCVPLQCNRHERHIGFEFWLLFKLTCVDIVHGRTTQH